MCCIGKATNASDADISVTFLQFFVYWHSDLKGLDLANANIDAEYSPQHFHQRCSTAKPSQHSTMITLATPSVVRVWLCH
jgi:hypothetical protein